MKNLRTTTIVLCSVFLFGIGALEAGELKWSDQTNAKMAHHKAKARMQKAQKGANGEDNANQGSCGSINVGNVTNTRPGSTPKEVTVIVAGDIVNAGNTCK